MKRYNELKPSFYDQFQCKGGACRYTCCQSWNIAMSRDEYRKWKKKGVLSKEEWDQYVTLFSEDKKTERNYALIRLTEEGFFCPLMDSEGLCQVQKEHGPQYLSNTCRIFPRQFHRYFDQVEKGMSLGCERVIELLLEEKDGILLEQGSAMYPPEFLYSTYYDQSERRKQPQLGSYYDIQTLCLALLQAEEVSMEGRLILLGIAMHRIDQMYQQGQGEDVAAYIGEYLGRLENSDVERMLEEIPAGNPLAPFNSVLNAMARMGPKNNPALSQVRERILERIKPSSELLLMEMWDKKPLEQWKTERYHECMEQFTEWIKGKEYFFENVMVAYLFYANIPYKDIKYSVWENYQYFVWVYVMLKISLAAYLGPESTEEDLIYCCAVLFRTLGHNVNIFHQIIEDYKVDGDTPAHMAILLKNCDFSTGVKKD